MNTLARNFSHTFRRFFTASVLNIIGLAIAFASFFVIMTQVDYDLNFNKGYTSSVPNSKEGKTEIGKPGYLAR